MPSIPPSLLVLVALTALGCSPATEERPLVLRHPGDELPVDGALRGRRCEPGGACDSGPVFRAPALFEAGGRHELRFEVANQTEQERWVLELYGQIDRVTVVGPDASAGETTGHFVAPEVRSRSAVRYALPLRLAPGETTEVVLDAQLTAREALRGTLLAEAPFRRRTLWRSSLVSFALGGMLFLALQALFIFLWTRDRTYLWYGVYALAGFALWSIHFGFAALVVPGGELRYELVATLVKTMVVFIGLFTMRFLDLWGAEGEWRFESRLAVVIGAMLLLAVPFDYVAGRETVKAVSSVATVVGMCFVLGVTVRALLQGKRRARFLMVGWFPVLGVAVVGIGSMFFADRPLVTRETVLPLHVWELAFAAFALADRLRILQRERDHAALEAERQRSAARTDALTGLENRAAFDAYVDAIEASEGAVAERDRTLVVFDVDGLKEVNDTRGHVVGDQMLRQLAEEVRSKLRAGDHLFRIGGDEFVLAIEAGDPAGEIMIRRLEAVVDAVRASGFVHFGLSAGHCSIAEVGGSAREAFRIADERMYEAKALHRAVGTRVSSFPGPR